MVDPNIALEFAGSAITAFGGIWMGGKHLLKRSNEKREQYRQDILEKAKEEITRAKESLEVKINKLEEELKTQKDSVARDMSHMKDTYNTEIRVLGQRIEELRQDLSAQHSSLVALLTKLVNTK